MITSCHILSNSYSLMLLSFDNTNTEHKNFPLCLNVTEKHKDFLQTIM
jgi:hypothetical protein